MKNCIEPYRLKPGQYAIVRMKDGRCFTGRLDAQHGSLAVFSGGWFFNLDTTTVRLDDVDQMHAFDVCGVSETYNQWAERTGFSHPVIVENP